MEYYTKSNANRILENKYSIYFDRFKELTALYSFKEPNGKYSLRGNVSIENKSTIFDLEDNIRENLKHNIILDYGEVFTTINSTSSNFKINSGDTIKNVERDAQGKLSFIFKIKNNYYIISNLHVIGRLGLKKDRVAIRVKNRFKQFATIITGYISENTDLCIAKIDDNFITVENHGFKIFMNDIVSFQPIIIKDTRQVILSTNAYIKVKDNYFFRTSKIMKNQILSNIKMSSGDSGSMVVDHSDKIVGILFAKNSNFSVINRISEVIKYISHTFNINENEIKILNI